jgi:hypothetical protein
MSVLGLGMILIASNLRPLYQLIAFALDVKMEVVSEEG